MFKKIISLLFVVLIIWSCMLPSYALTPELVATEAFSSIIYAALIGSGAVLPSIQTQGYANIIAQAIDSNIAKVIMGVRLIQVDGVLVARWTAAQWNAFTDWLMSTDIANTTVAVPSQPISLAAPPKLAINPNIDTLVKKDVGVCYQNDSKYNDFSLPSSPLILRYHRQRGQSTMTNAWLQLLSPVASAVIFSTGSAASALFADYHAAYEPYLYYDGASSLAAPALTLTEFTNYSGARLTLGDRWYISSSKYKLERVLLNIDAAGRISLGIHGELPIIGQWSSLFDYMADCGLAGDVLGLPDDFGTVTMPDNGTVQDTSVALPLDLRENLLPNNTDTYTPPRTLAPGRTIEWKLPYSGDLPLTNDTAVGDLTTDLPIDWDTLLDRPVVDELPVDVPIDQVDTLPWADSMPTYRDEVGTITANPSDVVPANPSDIDSDPDSDRLRLPDVIITKFPFCIPWDVKNLLSVLNVEPRAPVFTIPFVIRSWGIIETVKIDLTQFPILDSWYSAGRWFVFFGFILTLVLFTLKIIRT